MSNFLFLKKNNEDLFNIISEAENLFRDEYFEQSIVQIRRFAENICRDLLQDKALPDETFDSMISTIKDNSFRNMRMKEFSEDLYFLKKQGNNSAHSAIAAKNGKVALECLERAFEIAIFYSNVKFGYSKKLDKTVFSEELLMTGKKTPQKSLKEKYSKELHKARTKSSATKPHRASKSTKKRKSKKKNSAKKKIIFTIIFVAVIALLFLFLNY